MEVSLHLCLTLVCPSYFMFEKNISYLEYKKLGGPYRQSGYFGEELHLLL
jgi:hypothetical protein